MTSELIKKLEALEAPDEAVFREVFMAVSPIPYGGAAHGRWMALEPEFEAKIKCQAWESAAIMLVPEFVTGWSINVDGDQCEALCFRNGDGVIGRGNAKHPAIALMICILEAQEETP